MTPNDRVKPNCEFPRETPPSWRRIAAAMLDTFLPARPWQGLLELIWELETDGGVNRSALRPGERRFRCYASFVMSA